MDLSAEIIYGILTVIALGQSALLILQTWEHRRYAQSCLRHIDSRHVKGRVLVCAPLKGADIDMDENLRALFEQDYDDYEISFIVESEDDPAYSIVRRMKAEYPEVPSRIVVAGRADDEGQKVRNLLTALKNVSPRIEYFAFVDSDARPRHEWIRALVSRLSRSDVGAVTGYRWFVPKRETAANNLLYSLNCDLTVLLGRRSHHLVWGGSWAIRRELFDRLKIRDAWAQTLSDDLIASRILSKAKKEVRFEPACVASTPIDYTLGEAFAFVRRQHLLSRIYTPQWWFFAVTGTTSNILLWSSQFAALIYSLKTDSFSSWIPFCVIAAMSVMQVARGELRRKILAAYFPYLRKTLYRAHFTDTWLNCVVCMFHWTALIASAFGWRINWRGVSYDLSPQGKVASLRRESDAATLPLPGFNRESVSKASGFSQALRKLA